jgi:hypothetical protein
MVAGTVSMRLMHASEKPIADLKRCLWAILTTGSLLTIVGCNEANPLGRRPISGTVSFQGQPLEYGAIRFEPTGGENPVEAGAVITQGKYQIAEELGLPAGSYKVWITAPEQGQAAPVDEAPGETPRSQGKDRIPPQYNVQTTLVAEVPATGKAELNFDLK